VKLREFLASVRFPGSQLYGVTPERAVVDPSGLSFIRQLHNDREHFGGMAVTGADNAVLDGIRLVASLLGTGRLLIHSSCKNLISQLQSYSWDEKAADKGEDKPAKVDDHATDALRYALCTTRSIWRNELIPVEVPRNYQDTFGVGL
jgi:Terminase RNaseH-like domain